MAPEDFDKRHEDGEPRKTPRRLDISACLFCQDSVLQQLLGIQFLRKAASWAGPSSPLS
jgi:hypothetical protein